MDATQRGLLFDALGTGVHSTILDAVSEGIYVTDLDRRILYWNRGAEALTGYSAGIALGRYCRDEFLCHVDQLGRGLCHDGCPLAATLHDGLSREAEVFLHHREGHRVPVHVRSLPLYSAAGEIVAAVETFSDNTERLAAADRARDLERMAFLDSLTGLPNRRFLEMTVASRIDEISRYGGNLGIVLIDVDHFKHVNDQYGHEGGDRVLQVVARTLQGATRSFDVVGRWGGEEFLILLPGTDMDDLQAVATRYCALVGTSDVPLADRTVRVTISAGATCVYQGEDGVRAFRRADRLLYLSKEAGRNRVTVERPREESTGRADEGVVISL